MVLTRDCMFSFNNFHRHHRVENVSGYYGQINVNLAICIVKRLTPTLYIVVVYIKLYYSVYLRNIYHEELG